MAVNIQTPDEKIDEFGDKHPDIDEDSVNRGQSVTSIRGIPVRNTIKPPEGHSIPKMPSKLPFD